MAAPKGNDFWNVRSKHGRDKIFASPSVLEEAAREYFDYKRTDVRLEKTWVGKSAKEVHKEFIKPFTLKGLCIFLGVSDSYFRAFKSGNRGSDDPIKQDFLTVIDWIEGIIYTQQYEGAASGAFSATIISRALGLAEKINTTVEDVTDAINYDELSDDVLEAIHKARVKGSSNDQG